MPYNWNRKKLQKEKRMAKRRKDEISYNNLKKMLEEIEETTKKLDLDDNLSRKIFSYDMAKYMYEIDLDLIPNNLKDIAMNIYKLENNVEIILDEEIKKNDFISDDELVYLTKDLFNWLNDTSSIKLVNKLLDKNGYLNIHHDSQEFASNDTWNLYGITFHNPSFNKTYINLFRRNNINDFTTIIHELMHMIFFKIDKNYQTLYFDELEGIYGEVIASLYLKEHNYKDRFHLTRKNRFYEFLFDSLTLYINELAFSTSKNKKFRTQVINNKIIEDLNCDLDITKNKLIDFFNIYGFDIVTEVLNYSIIEDIIATSTTPQETFKRIKLLKENDNIETLENLENFGITFHKDNLKNLKVLKKKL